MQRVFERQPTRRNRHRVGGVLLGTERSRQAPAERDERSGECQGDTSGWDPRHGGSLMMVMTWASYCAATRRSSASWVVRSGTASSTPNAPTARRNTLTYF